MGSGLWGDYPLPGMTAPPPAPEARADESAGASEEQPEEATHLRSVREVTRYKIAAKDGEAGRIVDFVVDDRSWAMRYAVVERSRLPVSRKVLVAIEWIEDVDWVEQRVRLEIAVERIEEAPEFDPGETVNAESETVLYDYYGRPRGRTERL